MQGGKRRNGVSCANLACSARPHQCEPLLQNRFRPPEVARNAANSKEEIGRHVERFCQLLRLRLADCSLTPHLPANRCLFSPSRPSGGLSPDFAHPGHSASPGSTAQCCGSLVAEKAAGGSQYRQETLVFPRNSCHVLEGRPFRTGPKRIGQSLIRLPSRPKSNKINHL